MDTYLHVMHPVRTFLDPLRPLRTGSVSGATPTDRALPVECASETYPEAVVAVDDGVGVPPAPFSSTLDASTLIFGVACCIVVKR